MIRFLKYLSATTAVVGIFVAAGSAIILAFAQDWHSFSTAYIGLALIIAGAFGFKATDRR